MALSVKDFLDEVKTIKTQAEALSNKEYSDVLDSKGYQYIDLVMEGGGVLGIALVGYIYILEKAGIRFISIAGTSAGSIAALMLSAIDVPEKEKGERLIDIIANMPMNTFIDGKNDNDHDPQRFIDAISHLINTKNKSRLSILKSIFRFMTINDNLKKIHGLNRGDRFEQWLKEKLSEFGIYTLADLKKKMASTPDGWKLREASKYKASQLNGQAQLEKLNINNNYLCLIAADISTEFKIELPVMAELYWKNPQNINPAVFCRCSMSIPFVFKPYITQIPALNDFLKGKWVEQTGINFNDIKVSDFPPALSCFIDGGIMSNFPIDVFHNPTKIPTRPTFGVKLQFDEHNHEITSTIDIVAQSFNSARHAMNYNFIKKNPDYTHLVTSIDTGEIPWLDFNMSDRNKLELFKAGAEAALRFLNNFDWLRYKDIRRDIASAYKTGIPDEKIQRYFKNTGQH
ncbi:patatin-like phospholipase family protein [Klebsiella sp. NPDC088457]